MPEWTIYKNNKSIGQAKTWHKALDILIKQERINEYRIAHLIPTLIIVSESDMNGSNNFKIQQTN